MKKKLLKTLFLAVVMCIFAGTVFAAAQTPTLLQKSQPAHHKVKHRNGHHRSASFGPQHYYGIDNFGRVNYYGRYSPSVCRVVLPNGRMTDCRSYGMRTHYLRNGGSFGISVNYTLNSGANTIRIIH